MPTGRWTASGVACCAASWACGMVVSVPRWLPWTVGLAWTAWREPAAALRGGRDRRQGKEMAAHIEHMLNGRRALSPQRKRRPPSAALPLRSLLAQRTSYLSRYTHTQSLKITARESQRRTCKTAKSVKAKSIDWRALWKSSQNADGGLESLICALRTN